MTKLPIITIPEPKLRQKSLDLTPEDLKDEDLQTFFDDLIKAMYDDDGIGIASPQVGRNIRACIIGKDADRTLKDDLVLINPEWERLGRKTAMDTEGCLSVPGIFGEVKRYTHIKVKALGRHGEKIEFEAKNFFARVVQHETDHLNGILFIDRAEKTYRVDDHRRL